MSKPVYVARLDYTYEQSSARNVSHVHMCVCARALSYLLTMEQSGRPAIISFLLRRGHKSGKRLCLPSLSLSPIIPLRFHPNRTFSLPSHQTAPTPTFLLPSFFFLSLPNRTALWPLSSIPASSPRWPSIQQFVQYSSRSQPRQRSVASSVQMLHQVSIWVSV